MKENNFFKVILMSGLLIAFGLAAAFCDRGGRGNKLPVAIVAA